MYCELDCGEARGVGFAGFTVERGRWRDFCAADMEVFRELISAAELPSKVILKRGEERGRRDVNGVGAKGGFCIPTLGAIRSFWFSDGIERAVAIISERS